VAAVGSALAAAPPSGKDALDGARARAEAYLRDALLLNKCSDFRTPIGESTEWVAAYVAGCLPKSPENTEARRRTSAFLLGRQRWNGGWGYSALSPPDADSTAAALRLLAHDPNVPRSRIRRAREFLRRHIDRRSGGVRTYRRALRLRVLMRAWRTSFDGWLAPHVCVSAAAAQALSDVPDSTTRGVGRVVEFLLASQDSAGYWRGYWWDEPLYSTTVTLRVLRQLGLIGRVRVDPGPWIRSRERPDGTWANPERSTFSAFSTALALESLSLLRQSSTTPRASGLAMLARAQLPDGSWPSVPIMRIPHPDALSPRSEDRWRIDQLGTGVLLRDQHCRFTTATVLACTTALATDSRSG
jgi:hypothetical protein